MLEKSLIIKIIALIVVTFVVAKAIAPFVGETLWELVFGTKKKKNSDLDFDALISQKKSMLRGGMIGGEKMELTGGTSRKGETEEIVQAEYKELSQKANRSTTETKRFEELKKMIAMFDSLQWGNIKEIEDLEKKLSQTYSHRFSASSHFSFLLARGAFLDSQAKWVGLDKTYLAIETFTLLKEVFLSSTLRTTIAKRWQMSVISFDKSLCLILSGKKGKTTLASLAKANQVQVPTIKDLDLLSLLIISPGVLKNKSTILNELREKAEVFHALSPLPPLKSDKDLISASKSLGLSPKATIEQIKSRYKKLAQLKHPDTLKAKGIPSEFEGIATENFTQIKRAYDILIKEKNKS